MRWLARLLVVATLPACAATPGDRRARPTADPFAGTRQAMQIVMGTRLRVAIERRADVSTLLRRAFTVARRWDAVLSTYKPQSALSRHNRGELALRRALSPELARFLRVSQRLCRQTDGAFDVSLGAGCDAYALDAAARLTRRSPKPLDPGGIGKGLAVDAIVALLRRAGVKRAFIDFGGSSFYGLGGPWRVALSGAADNGRALGLIALRDQALSSSKSRTPRGRAHIIDPRSGGSVPQQRVAAARGPSATVAEALSTALIVDPGALSRWRRRFPRYRLWVR